jgi:hypothetical protein
VRFPDVGGIPEISTRAVIDDQDLQIHVRLVQDAVQSAWNPV